MFWEVFLYSFKLLQSLSIILKIRFCANTPFYTNRGHKAHEYTGDWGQWRGHGNQGYCSRGAQGVNYTTLSHS